MFTKNNCDHASPLLSEVLGEKLDMPGCARLFFFLGPGLNKPFQALFLHFLSEITIHVPM